MSEHLQAVHVFGKQKDHPHRSGTLTENDDRLEGFEVLWLEGTIRFFEALVMPELLAGTDFDQ